jgi:hypothetical protein
VNFEEYKPEKSPSLNSEKLSIKLPPEEFRKRHKSPLRHHGDIFTFVNEDQLFTRTKSLVVETAIKPGQSPKRVLIPPTLSPLCSPCVSPRKNEHVLTDICPNKDYDVLFSTSSDKWVAFPNVSNPDTISQNNSIKSNIANEDGNYTKNNNGARGLLCLLRNSSGGNLIESFSLFKEGDFSGLYSSKFTTFMGVVLRGLSTGLFVT